MSVVVRLNEVARMMRALVAEAPGDEIDISAINIGERSFLLVTCSAEMIAYTVCDRAGYEKTKALEGLDALLPDLKAKIIKICDGQR